MVGNKIKAPIVSDWLGCNSSCEQKAVGLNAAMRLIAKNEWLYRRGLSKSFGTRNTRVASHLWMGLLTISTEKPALGSTVYNTAEVNGRKISGSVTFPSAGGQGAGKQRRVYD
ncbi:hypothetical protein A4R69_00110 [Corynebacterium pseudotuberculosis]|nr:Hypothetical protein CpE19_0020 [Corynebacterium pseudotuberculosis]AMN70984.1 hypothetical protein ATN03_00110 [Corynebacterium pseudotuberculosis]APB12035.1 hypothetical protein A4R71_00115 [Corynebacterium pseudotuberculosis]APB28331.1 hypothetical protein A4R69_00110 [Corynebacterium pseudotuberculosis]